MLFTPWANNLLRGFCPEGVLPAVIPKKWSTPDLTIWAISAPFPMKMELVDAGNNANI